MDEKWKVKAYESLSGDIPVEEFIKSLDEKARLKVSRTLDLLEEFGLEKYSSFCMVSKRRNKRLLRRK